MSPLLEGSALEALKAQMMPTSTEIDAEIEAGEKQLAALIAAKAAKAAKSLPFFQSIALPLAARGLKVILIDGKVAFLDDHQKEATSDPEKITVTWARYGDYNVGVYCIQEPGGVVIVDCDDFDPVTEYKRETGKDVPVTYTVRSSPGKLHQYFRQTTRTLALPANITEGSTGGKFSLRLKNYYVAAEGSVHPIHRQPYRALVPAPIVDIPDDYLDWLLSKVEKSKPVDASLNGEKIPYGQHDTTLFKIACKIREVLGLEEDGITNCLIEICEKRCEGYGEDYREMCANKARSACKYPAGTNGTAFVGSSNGSAESAGSSESPDFNLTFKHPAVPNPHDDFVIGAAVGSNEGWFPLGELSLIGGPSGANKSTFMIDLLETQVERGDFLSHKTFGRPYVILMADRGENAHIRTATRMRLKGETPIRRIEVTQGGAAIQNILREIEACEALPQVVFIEGCDLLVEDACKMHFVAPFIKALQTIAAHYHIAIVGSVGTGKAKKGEGYEATRDKIFGSVTWGRMTETIAVLQYVQGDDTDPRRMVHVLLRNGAPEKYKMTLSNGRLVLDRSAEKGASVRTDLMWYQAQPGWFTATDYAKGLGISPAQGYKDVKEALTKRILRTKKTVQGEARQYHWNEGPTNPESVKKPVVLD